MLCPVKPSNPLPVSPYLLRGKMIQPWGQGGRCKVSTNMYFLNYVQLAHSPSRVSDIVISESLVACKTQCSSQHVLSLIQTCFQYAVSNIASDPDILNHNPPTRCLYLFFFFNVLYPHEDLSPPCSNLIPSPEPCSVPPGLASLKCSPVHILVNTVI